VALSRAIGVVAAALVQRRWDKEQELERVRRERTAPIYEELVAILQDPQVAEKQAAGFFKELTTKLLLYGPAPIVREWSALKRQGPSDDLTDPTALLNYEKFLLLVRKDFGHNDSTLVLGDLLRTYVNDFDEMYALWMGKQAQGESQPVQIEA
jgi:hypothetical protein